MVYIRRDLQSKYSGWAASLYSQWRKLHSYTHTHIQSLVPTIPHTKFTIYSAQFRSVCGSTARRIHAQENPYHQNHHKHLTDPMQASREILRPKGSSSLTSSQQIQRNNLRSQGIFTSMIHIVWVSSGSTTTHRLVQRWGLALGCFDRFLRRPRRDPEWSWDAERRWEYLRSSVRVGYQRPRKRRTRPLRRGWSCLSQNHPHTWSCHSVPNRRFGTRSELVDRSPQSTQRDRMYCRWVSSPLTTSFRWFPAATLPPSAVLALEVGLLVLLRL